MSCEWFEKIISKMKYNNDLSTLFMDKLWDVIHMIRSWKYHMKDFFKLSGLIVFIVACPFFGPN